MVLFVETWLYAVLSVVSLALSTFALVAYMRRQNKAHPYGMLITQIMTFVVHGLINVPFSICQLLANYGFSGFSSFYRMDPDINLYGGFVTAVILSDNFVYASGALLALDRVLLMTFPVAYKHWKVNIKLPMLTASIFVLTDVISILAIVILPFSASDRLTATYLVDQIYKFYCALFIAETSLHILFCVQFWLYSRRQNNEHAKQQIVRANQIVLFQILSQSVLCLIPNTLNFVNLQFFQMQIVWMHVLSRMYGLFFVINIILSTSFVVYKMWWQHKKCSRVNSLLTTAKPSCSNKKI